MEDQEKVGEEVKSEETIGQDQKEPVISKEKINKGINTLMWHVGLIGAGIISGLSSLLIYDMIKGGGKIEDQTGEDSI